MGWCGFFLFFFFFLLESFNFSEGGMKRERRVNGGLGLGFEDDCNDVNGSYRIASSSASSSTPLKHTSSPVAVGIVGSGVAGGLSYIEHPVSKFDTLAGVAIKYGVEVFPFLGSCMRNQFLLLYAWEEQVLGPIFRMLNVI